MANSLIDLNRLQIFRAIALSGSMTKAAIQLRQPKSRVSRQLAQLEKEVGAQLFFRSTRSLRLTPTGQELFRGAMPHLASLQDALEHVAQGVEEISGRIRISVPDDIGTQLMAGICDSFLSLYPNVQLEVHVSNQIVDLIRESFDIAIRIGRLKDSALIQRKIGLLRTVTYISPELRNKLGPILSPSDLVKVPYLAFSANNSGHLRFVKDGERRSVRVRPSFASNSFFVLRELAIKNHGFAAIPSFLADDALARGQLVLALREWSLDSVPAQIVLPPQKEIPLRTRRFVEHLRGQLAPYAY